MGRRLLEEQQHQQRLDDIARQYRALFDHHPFPMWIYDVHTFRFLAVNDAACEQYGYSREEMLGMSVLDIRPEEDRAAAQEAMRAPGSVGGQVWRHRTRSGELLQVAISAQWLHWYGHEARLTLARDVTAERRLGEQLRRSEEQLRQVLESTGEGIFMEDAAGLCVWCNPAAVRLLGYASAEELIGHNMHDLAHHTRADGRPLPAAECPMLIAAQQGEGWSGRDELLFRRDGSSFHADVNSFLIWREGRIGGAVLSVNDVEARFQAESEYKQLEAQFRQAQKMESIGLLAGGVAHDFNNLLTVITGYSQLLQTRKDLDPKVRQAVDQIKIASDRAAALTRQLLAFSRQQVLDLRVLELPSVVERAALLLQPMVGERYQLVISVDAAPPPQVRADAAQLEQVLMNLVVNARDAQPTGGRIEVRTGRAVIASGQEAQSKGLEPGVYATLTVTDRGCGMDAATQSRIFEPFFTTKPTGQGTGLGMATVFGIVQQCGANLSVHSEVGRGTTVLVYLPAFEGAEAAADAVPAGGAQNCGHEHILLVEDEPELLKFASLVLTEIGYEVSAFATPEAAIAHCRGGGSRPDLLVTDVILPGRNGPELAAELRRHWPGLRVVFISGYPSQSVLASGALSTGSGFLQKPFGPAALAAKVRAALDSPAAAAAGRGTD